MKYTINIILGVVILSVLYFSINPYNYYSRLTTKYNDANVISIGIDNRDIIVIDPTNILESIEKENFENTQPIKDTFTYNSQRTSNIFEYSVQSSYKGITTGKDTNLLIYNESEYKDKNLYYKYELINDIKDKDREYILVIDIVDKKEVQRIDDYILIYPSISNCYLKIQTKEFHTIKDKYLYIPMKNNIIEFNISTNCNDR